METIVEDRDKLTDKTQQVFDESNSQQSVENLVKELAETKSDLHDTREELERTQSQFDEVLTELEQYHIQLSQLQQEREKKQQIEPEFNGLEEREKKELQVQETEAVLERCLLQLRKTDTALEESIIQLYEKQEEVQNTQSKLNQVKDKLKKNEVKMQQNQAELEKLQTYFAAHVKRLISIIMQTAQDERLDLAPNGRGSVHQRSRIAQVAEYCAQGWGGDIIEIGCWVGATTHKLAEVARRYNRRVVAVDPWEIGTQNCKGGEYEKFLSAIEGYEDIVDIVRLSSLDQKAINLIKKRSFCFAFVDGLHTYEACLSDIQTVSHCQGVIAVDDILWSPKVEQAFFEGATIINRQKLHLPTLREGYLL